MTNNIPVDSEVLTEFTVDIYHCIFPNLGILNAYLESYGMGSIVIKKGFSILQWTNSTPRYILNRNESVFINRHYTGMVIEEYL